MSFACQVTSPRNLARQALAELDAPEPNLELAQLMGGPLAWGESWVAMVEAERDPANAPTMRPHVIALCQGLSKHPALRLKCTCRKGLDYLALASMATGILVVSSPTLRSPNERGGGPNDLGPVDGQSPGAGWALIPWERSMRSRAAAHQTSWQDKPDHPVLGVKVGIVGDTAKRQVFNCSKCGATPTFLNITLLRLVLQAIAADQRSVWVGGVGAGTRARSATSEGS